VAFVYLLVACLAAAVAVFALQNGTPATVHVFVWNLVGVPLAGLILGAFARRLYAYESDRRFRAKLWLRPVAQRSRYCGHRGCCGYFERRFLSD
jgi:hypothetical protein